jgi:alkylhydroperoxidase family enzyme
LVDACLRVAVAATRYTADMRIDRQLAELLRLRVRSSTTAPTASTCTIKRREAGIPRAKIDTLTAWRETELHSEAEQAALRYTEALTRAADTDRDAAFQRFHEALAENFNPEEILEIVGVVVNMNVWTRIKLAEGAMPGPRHTGHSDDKDKDGQGFVGDQFADAQGRSVVVQIGKHPGAGICSPTPPPVVPPTTPPKPGDGAPHTGGEGGGLPVGLVGGGALLVGAALVATEAERRRRATTRR